MPGIFFVVPSRSDLPGITCLSLSVTLISALGCAGLTDRPLYRKMGISLGSSRLTDNQLSGSCRLLGALSGSDGQNGSIEVRPRISGALNKLLCLHNGRYQP